MAIRPGFIVVDDHPLYRHGVTMLIDEELHLECLGEAGTLPEAMELLSAKRPQLAIVDISLQGQSGLELVRAIRAEWPDTAVLIVSMHEENLYGERALKAGARGYVMKHQSPDLLLRAVKLVLEGKIAVSEELERRMLEGIVGGKGERDPMSRLSDRELEVFTLIGKGFGAAEIAERLCISAKTVNAYRDHLKDKLDLSGAAELRKMAVEWNAQNSA
jgi:DNA-binding NarL/FixJ family response regulator